MLRIALAFIASVGSAASAVASEWRFERDAGREVRILVASSTVPGDLTFTCEPGSGTFDWALSNLPEQPNDRANPISFGTTFLFSGLLERPVRIPTVTFQRRMISPANDRQLPDGFVVQLRDGGPSTLFLVQGGNIIGLPGPALDAHTLLRHARATEATGTTLRLGGRVFDVTGIGAAISRLTDACVGPRD